MKNKDNQWLDDLLFELPNAWCQDCEHPVCAARYMGTRKAILSHIDTLVREARIDEVKKLSEKQQVFEGYGFDELGVDIDHFDDRLAELQKEIK